MGMLSLPSRALSQKIKELYLEHADIQSCWSRHAFSQLVLQLLKAQTSVLRISEKKSKKNLKKKYRKITSRVVKRDNEYINYSSNKSSPSKKELPVPAGKFCPSVSVSCTYNDTVDVSWALDLINGGDGSSLNWGRQKCVNISSLNLCLETGRKGLSIRTKLSIKKPKNHSRASFVSVGTSVLNNNATIFIKNRNEHYNLANIGTAFLGEQEDVHRAGDDCSSHIVQSDKINNFARNIFRSYQEDANDGVPPPSNAQAVIELFDSFNNFFSQSPITAWESIYSICTEPEIDPDMRVEVIRNAVTNSQLNLNHSEFDHTVYRGVLALGNVNLNSIQKDFVVAIDKGLMSGSMALKFLRSFINVSLNVISCGIYGLVNLSIEALPSLYQLLSGQRSSLHQFINSPRQLINTGINDWLNDLILNMGVKTVSMLAKRGVEDNAVVTRIAPLDDLPDRYGGEQWEKLTDGQKLNYFIFSNDWVDSIRFILWRRDLKARKSFKGELRRLGRGINYDPDELFKRIVFLGVTQNVWFRSAYWWKKQVIDLAANGAFSNRKLESEYKRYIRPITD